jgi:hypothetical protein
VREKQKGNEAFKANELDEAFVFYSRSLALDDTVAAVHANRALVSIKLEKLETGEDDASRALLIDPNHMKALSRRGLARLKLGKIDLVSVESNPSLFALIVLPLTHQAIEDFQWALDLKPGNPELMQLLDKAKAKYLEVEGREYGTDPIVAISTAPVGLSLIVTAVSSSKELLLPSHTKIMSSGLLHRVEKKEEKFTRLTIEESDGEDGESGEETLTRIPIEESDAEEEGRNQDSNPAGFTRIAIQMESDSEEEDEAENKAPVAPPPNSSSFTRIPIAITESDSEDEPSEEEKEATALSFKEKGNEFMKCEDYLQALHCYTESLNLSSHGPHSIAALSNRALTYLQLKVQPNDSFSHLSSYFVSELFGCGR